jgi:hypothetical protein
MTKFTLGGCANGTSLQGYVKTTYSDLVAIFGEPERGGDKTTVEWCIDFEDGTVATIYDWKEYDTPMGEYNWHVGGRSYMASVLVSEVVAEYQSMVCEQISAE